DHFVHTFPPILKILENPYMVFYGFSRIQGRHGWFTGYTLDTYGDANADALTFASVKLKDTFNDNTDYFKSEEEQEDTEEE
ncbi:hypothetical protein ACTQ4Z_09605, partial [Anaerovoracaceae bacterium Sow4_D4]